MVVGMTKTHCIGPKTHGVLYKLYVPSSFPEVIGDRYIENFVGLEKRSSKFENLEGKHPGWCECVYSVVSDSLRPHGLQPAKLHCPWDFPGKNTGVGCHFLLQGILLTQGSKQVLSLLRWKVGSSPLVPPGKWKLLSCVRLFVTPWIIHGIL